MGGAGHLESKEGQASSPVLLLGKPRVGMELGAFKKERVCAFQVLSCVVQERIQQK